MKIFGPLALVLLSHSTALALPQRHPGLWRQTTETRFKFNPEFTPEERAIFLKPGGPLSDATRSTDVCVTSETNAFEKVMLQRALASHNIGTCKTEARETDFTSTSQTVCGKTGSVTRTSTSWKGDTHFTSETYSKTFSTGRSVESTVRTYGDFVGGDCGNVKAPFVPRTLGVKNDRGPGEPPLFDAFNRYCIQTRVRYHEIARIANVPASIFRREWQATDGNTTRWQVGGPFTYLTAQSGKSPRPRHDYESCEMSTQRVDAQSLETMRRWLGPRSLPTFGWKQDFLWDQDKRTAISTEAAHRLIAAGNIVWQLSVSKSVAGKETTFRLSRSQASKIR